MTPCESSLIALKIHTCLYSNN